MVQIHSFRCMGGDCKRGNDLYVMFLESGEQARALLRSPEGSRPRCARVLPHPSVEENRFFLHRSGDREGRVSFASPRRCAHRSAPALLLQLVFIFQVSGGVYRRGGSKGRKRMRSLQFSVFFQQWILPRRGKNLLVIIFVSYLIYLVGVIVVYSGGGTRSGGYPQETPPTAASLASLREHRYPYGL